MHLEVETDERHEDKVGDGSNDDGAGLELGVHLLVPLELLPGVQVENSTVTEDGDIEEHERDEGEDDGSELIISLLEGNSEHVNQLVDINDGEISPDCSSVVHLHL